MRSARIAAAVAVAITIAIHIYDCQTGTREQCLMSRGLLWVYWIVSFLATWGLVGMIGATIESFRNNDRR